MANSGGNGQLSYYYIDNHNEIQGPFEPEQMMRWIEQNWFQDETVVRFTDNGKRIGNAVTYQTTMKDLKEQFGGATIPTNLDEFKFRGIHIEGPGLPPALVPVTSEHRYFGNQQLPKSEHLEGSSSRRCARPSMKLYSARERAAVGRPIPQHLPFYDGSSVQGREKIGKKTTFELTLFLRMEYAKLSEEQKAVMCSYCDRPPKRCRFCEKPIVDFIYHVTSETHIQTVFRYTHLDFTFQDDYLKIKNLFELVGMPSISSQPSALYSSKYPSDKNGTGDAVDRCNQS